MSRRYGFVPTARCRVLKAVTCGGCGDLLPDGIHLDRYDGVWLPFCERCASERWPYPWDRAWRCPVCARRVVMRRDGSRPPWYCSTECHADAEQLRRKQRTRRALPSRSCPTCAAPFVPRRSDARYCSGACRQKAHRQARKRAA